MILVVTGVGFLIHVYSIGYMARRRRLRALLRVPEPLHVLDADARARRQPAALFVGWEGVGLCSYLLIGFWYDEDRRTPPPARRPSSSTASATSASCSACSCSSGASAARRLGALRFDSADTRRHAKPAAGAWRSRSRLLLFVGATGKSAQIPLYVWLPDAMAGPTPVSALIHAATMVTAGVYMVARLHVLFALAPAALHGRRRRRRADGALRGDRSRLAQTDIKKVLAYSTVSASSATCSSALGVGAFGAAIFHL